jgi:hypothetical protein
LTVQFRPVGSEPSGKEWSGTKLRLRGTQFGAADGQRLTVVA